MDVSNGSTSSSAGLASLRWREDFDVVAVGLEEQVGVLGLRGHGLRIKVGIRQAVGECRLLRFLEDFLLDQVELD